MRRLVLPLVMSVLLIPGSARAQLPLFFEAAVGTASYSGEMGDAYESGPEWRIGAGFAFVDQFGLFLQRHTISLDCIHELCGDDVVFDVKGLSAGTLITPVEWGRFAPWIEASILNYDAEQVGLTADGDDNSFASPDPEVGFRFAGGIRYRLYSAVFLTGSVAYGDITVPRESILAPQAPPFGEQGRARTAPVRDVLLKSTVLSIGLRVGPFGG